MKGLLDLKDKRWKQAANAAYEEKRHTSLDRTITPLLSRYRQQGQALKKL